MYKIYDRLYIDIHESKEQTKDLIIKSKRQHITSTDYHESHYSINICNIVKFINYIDKLYYEPKIYNKDIIYYVYLDKNNSYLLNSVFLFGCYLVIKQNIQIDYVINILLEIFNSHPCYYIDCVSKHGGYYSSIIDCLKSINFIYKNNIENINNFDIENYEYMTDYFYRDMNLIANKFIAMACPTNKNILNIKDILKKNECKIIIRLNSDSDDFYDKNVFLNNNINTYDLYFDDYSIPNLEIVKKFMNIINNTDLNEIVAIHCKAGLGRTGLLICIWLIIKLNFEPREAIAYLRIMRPGSIMGSQGFFIENIDYYRKFI
jgi:cell division cycle 14